MSGEFRARKVAGGTSFPRRLLRIEDPGSPAMILTLALFGLSALLFVGARVRRLDGGRITLASAQGSSTIATAGLLTLVAAVTMLVLAHFPFF